MYCSFNINLLLHCIVKFKNLYMKKLPLLLASAAVIAITSCASQKEVQENGIALNLMDTSVRPQDDFFTYVNGNWVKTV